MSDSRGGFKPINQLWGGTGSTDADSECLYEEISGPSAAAQQRNIRRSRKLEQHASSRAKRSSDANAAEHPPRHRSLRYAQLILFGGPYGGSDAGKCGFVLCFVVAKND